MPSSAPDNPNTPPRQARALRGPFWGGARRRGLFALVLLLAALLGLGWQRADDYASTQRAYCAGGCHHASTAHPLHVYDSPPAAHAALPCQRCHADGTDAGAPERLPLLLAWMTRGLVGTPQHGTASPVACQSCHGTATERGARLAATRGHRDHLASVGADGCLACHGLPGPARSGVGRDRKPRHENAAPADEVPNPVLSSPVLSSPVLSGPVLPDAALPGAEVPTVDARRAELPSVGSPRARQGDPRQSCAACHASQSLHASAIAGECTSCHGFTERPDAPSTASACRDCHDRATAPQPAAASAPKLPAGALHGDVVCAACHDPHREGMLTQAMSEGCRSCHDLQVGDRRHPSGPAHGACPTCHRAHDPPGAAQRACLGCHTRPPPTSPLRPSASALEHAPDDARHRVATQPPEGTARPSGGPPAPLIEVDAAPAALGAPAQGRNHQTCASCHLPHHFAARLGDCAGCHQPQARGISESSPLGHALCADCHEPHAPEPTTAACLGCHARPHRAGGVAMTHPTCLGCHAPHAASLSALSACAQCHAPVAATVAERGPEQHAARGCAACHGINTPANEPGRACAGCHPSQAQGRARAPAEHARCETCHAPHAFARPESGRCVACHSLAGPSAGSHRGACTECHAPHGAPDVATASCKGCHAEVHPSPFAAGHPHARCASCHGPHQAAETALERCGDCHAEQRRIASTWPARSPHASACTGCHQPHAPRATPECRSCHARQAQADLGPGHTCQGCHQPHASPAADSKQWNLTCAQCHPAEARATLDRGPKHAACASCHEPHTATPPACSLCHTSGSLAGLHRRGNHELCTSCHDTHADTPVPRAACLACHQQRAAHHPDAASCQSCHLFR